MNNNYEARVEQELFHLFLYQHHPENLGSFTRALLDAWSKADVENDRRLTSAFPELGEALFRFRSDPSIIDKYKGD